jgi:serine/threonine-protein kinase
VAAVRKDQPATAKAPPSAAGAHKAITPAPAAVPSGEEEQPPIHGYRIHEVLGAGDLGTTYRATRLASGEACALKVIAPAARSDEKAIQNFLREVSILKQLQHANIVRLIEMGASGTDLFLSMEYLAALRWTELSAAWSTAQRVRIACGLMCQVLAALEYAHSQLLVHRDVKPANVLIYRSNGKLAAKLADFGLAKCYTTAGMSQVTREGDVVGSLPYMSPEQFINSREAKPGCDVYSAGATLYWMLAGQDPIVLENHPCKFLAILEDPPIPLLQRCPDVPAALALLVHKALEKSPESRFASAAEMRRQLREFAR